MDVEYKAVRLVETKASDPAGSFSGYGAVFGNEDGHGDVIEAGAFAQTLKEWTGRGKWPPMLLQHGGGIFGGGADDMLPVGQWTHMAEDRRGLKVDGQLFALGTERAQYIYEGLKTGVLDGLSIGYKTREAVNGTRAGEPDRTLTNIDLWEVSIVTFPANPKARVSSVKSFSKEQWRELEDALWKHGGLSRADCKRAMPVLRQWLQRDAGVPDNGPREVEAPPEATEVLAALARNAEALWSEVFRR